jgi:hypothetical protein
MIESKRIALAARNVALILDQQNLIGLKSS